MPYGDLLKLYFERSNALQGYWTLYVVIIGGLLAFSSLRQRPDTVTTLLITVLYVCFAYKNMGAIADTTLEREAFLSVLKGYAGEAADLKQVRAALEPHLLPSTVSEVRSFHLTSDLLTLAALWAMEWRRRRSAPATP